MYMKLGYGNGGIYVMSTDLPGASVLSKLCFRIRILIFSKLVSLSGIRNLTTPRSLQINICLCHACILQGDSRVWSARIWLVIGYKKRGFVEWASSPPSLMAYYKRAFTVQTTENEFLDIKFHVIINLNSTHSLQLPHIWSYWSLWDWDTRSHVQLYK